MRKYTGTNIIYNENSFRCTLTYIHHALKFAFVYLISVSSLFTHNNGDKQTHKYLINCSYTLAKHYLIGCLINIFALI